MDPLKRNAACVASHSLDEAHLAGYFDPIIDALFKVASGLRSNQRLTPIGQQNLSSTSKLVVSQA